MKSLILVLSLLLVHVFMLQAQTISLIRNLNISGTPPQFASKSPETLEYISCNGTLFFTTSSGTFASNKCRLWRTNGDSTNTMIVKEFKNPIYGLTSFNNKIYFVVNESPYGYELWVSDGTDPGTQMLKEINPYGNAFSLNLNNNSSRLLNVFNNKLFFIADNGVLGKELWSSDGTAAGTQMFLETKTTSTIHGIDGVLSEIIITSNKFFFNARDNADTFRVWVSDGTVAGTHAINNMMSSGYSAMVGFNGKIYCGGTHINGNSRPFGLVSSDGTEAGTALIIPGKENIRDDYAVLNGTLYFLYKHPSSNDFYAILMTDGTTQGSKILKDSLTVHSWAMQNYRDKPASLTSYNNKLYFCAATYPITGNSSSANYQLWSSDGTTAGTQQLTNFSFPLIPQHLTVGNGKLFFKGRNNSTIDLWQSDGTVQGTQPIIFPNAIPYYYLYPDNIRSPMSLYNNTLYFDNMYDTTKGRDLYRLDLFPTNVQQNTKVNKDMLIYPNPAGNIITVKEDQIDQLDIYDLSGKRLIQSRQNKIDISGLVPGTYLIEIHKQGKISTGKLIKE